MTHQHTDEEIVEEFAKEFPLLYVKQIMTSEPMPVGQKIVDWLRTTLSAVREEERERIKELVAHSSYDIDPGGRVSKRHDDAETVCHGIIRDIDALTPNQIHHGEAG